MDISGKIITIGLSPCWDITYSVADLEWNTHPKAESTTIRPAGKALNVSRALAWMKKPSIACGLWGKSDYELMQTNLSELSEFIDLRMTAVPGRTRINATAIDIASDRELHLRSKNELVSGSAIEALKNDLRKTISANDLCVFSGALPDSELIDNVEDLISFCKEAGATVALDTSGPAISRLVDSGYVDIVKPNVRELGQIVDRKLPNCTDDIISCATGLLQKVGLISVTRGEKGAIVLSDAGIWIANCSANQTKVISTVGCGDWFFAGLLASLTEVNAIETALESAIKAATAKALGLSDSLTWKQAHQQVQVQIEKRS